MIDPIDMGSFAEYRLAHRDALERMIEDRVLENRKAHSTRYTCKFVPKYNDDELTMDDIYPETEDFMSMYELLEQHIHLINLLERNDMQEWTSKFAADKQLAGLCAINRRIVDIMSEVETRLAKKLADAE
jgi:hypothetical protein